MQRIRGRKGTGRKGDKGKGMRRDGRAFLRKQNDINKISSRFNPLCKHLQHKT